MRLELVKPCMKKIKRRHPLRIRTHAIDARIRHRLPRPSIRNRNREPLSLLHRHRRRHQLQPDERVVVFRIPGRKRKEGIQHLVAGLDLLLALAQRQSLGVGTDLVVDHIAPEFESGAGGAFNRRGDPGDVEIFDVVVVVAVIGEAGEFGSRVESVERGVAGRRVRTVVEAVAEDAFGRFAALRVLEVDIARAGRYGTFEVGGIFALDA